MNVSYSCRLFGLHVDCDFPLPATRPAEPPGRPDLVINWSPFSAGVPGSAPAERGHTQTQDPVLSRLPDGGIRLVWPGEITAEFSRDGRHVSLHSAPAKREFLPAIATGIVMGVALRQQGVVCLHGAVLGRDGLVVGVLGNSGVGKSTVAAELLLQGGQLYADDIVVIVPDDTGAAAVQPGLTGVRLCPETATALLPKSYVMNKVPYGDKYLWDLSKPHAPCQGQYANSSAPLSGLYWLQSAPPGHGITISSPLPVPRALGTLIDAMYPPMMRAILTNALLERIAWLAETVPVRVVRYEQKWEHLTAFEQLLMP